MSKILIKKSTLLLFIALVAPWNMASSQTMPVPSGQQSFTYQSVDSAVVNADPSQAKPIAVGAVAAGGDTFGLSIGFPAFSGPADIYVAVSAPEVNPGTFYLLNPDGTFRPLSANIAAWMSAVTGLLNEAVFSDIPAAAARHPGSSAGSSGRYKPELLRPPGKRDGE